MPSPKFDPAAPCLILAPHLVYPPRTGANLLIDRTACALSRFTPYVDVLASDRLVRYQEGREVACRSFENRMRSKRAAALRVLARRSHFYLEKFTTPAFRREALTLLRESAYRTVFCSYITTARLLTETPGLPAGRRHLIFTHNDEFKWFRDLRRTTANPLGKLAAYFSERWLHGFFRRHARDFLFLHVTEEDRKGYARHYPDHPSLIVPIGVELPPAPAPPLAPDAKRLRLIFVGSLGVKMNRDALTHFARRYLPPLRARFGDTLEVIVAGSAPSPAVRTLCREHGWRLHPDVSSEELRSLYKQATFALLPFPYATGAKLKLLGALAHGVPFLATEAVRSQAEACVYPSLIDSDPAAWIDRIETIRHDGLSAAHRDALFAVARTHSWEASVRRMIRVLNRPPTLTSRKSLS